MNFVNDKKDGNGFTYDVDIFNQNRHKENGVNRTGQNIADRVCNIYDLEGNCCEYIAEIIYIATGGIYDNSNIFVYDIYRGGQNNDSISASKRQRNNGEASENISFRIVLYVM